MIIETYPQLSPEWFAATAGNPGASNCDKIITTKGERSKQRDDYLRQLAGEFIIGKREETYTSQAMILGMEREAQARQLFEMLHGEVKQVGLVWKDDRRLFHASPDGLQEPTYGDGGAGLEIKCPMIKTHVKYLLENTFPMDYFQQVQMGLHVTGYKKWYFMSYYEGLPPFIVECARNEAFIRALQVELDSFCLDLKVTVNRIGGPAERPAPTQKNSPGGPQHEPMAPNECPARPDTTMTKKYCDTCKDRLGCPAWTVKYQTKGE